VPVTSGGNTPKNIELVYTKDTMPHLARNPADHNSSHVEEEDTIWMLTLPLLPTLPVGDQNFPKPKKWSYKPATPAFTVLKEDTVPKIVARNKRTVPRAAEVPLTPVTRPTPEKSP